MGLQEISGADDRQLQEIADVLAGSHKILLVTGAGISTSCGIPDFRSKDGLYNIIPEQAILPPTPPPSQPATPTLKRTISMLEDEELSSSQTSQVSTSSRRSSTSPSSKLRGQDLFDSRVFQNAASTTLFYQFIASLRQKIQDEVQATSSVHKFVRVLRDGGRLMRCYTQNIDGLENREGLVTELSRGKGNKRRFMKKHYEVPRPAHVQGTDFDGGCEVVQLHGDLEKLRCTMCAAQFAWTDDETDIYLEGAAPHCQKCKAKSEERQASGKRGLAMGSLRPNIVLYGEDHPSNSLLTPLIPFDASCQPEVMVIMGTSLKVFGLQKMVREFAKAVHTHKRDKGRVVFVNRTRPAESVWDGIIDDFVSMDCDDWVEDLRRRRSDLWLRQGDIGLSVTKSAMPKKKRKSMDEEVEGSQRSTKKAKVVVEIPRQPSRPPPQKIPKASKNPSVRLLTPKKSGIGLNRTVRGILSPLAQAKRPPISPLTSPVRPDDQELRPKAIARHTPMRPTFSPFPTGVLSGSTLKTQMLPDDIPNEDDEPDETPTHTAQIVPSFKRPSKSWEGRFTSRQRTTEGGHGIRLVTQLWQYMTEGRPEPNSPAMEAHEEELGDDMIEADTPSRGPRGRKVDVFADKREGESGSS